MVRRAGRGEPGSRTRNQGPERGQVGSWRLTSSSWTEFDVSASYAGQTANFLSFTKFVHSNLAGWGSLGVWCWDTCWCGCRSLRVYGCYCLRKRPKVQESRFYHSRGSVAVVTKWAWPRDVTLAATAGDHVVPFGAAKNTQVAKYSPKKSHRNNVESKSERSVL